MERTFGTLMAACVLLAVMACEQPATEDGASADSMAPVAVAEQDEHATAGQEAEGHAHAAEGEEGQALLPIMQRLGSEMVTLTYALMTDDHETVASSAEAIAAHVPISAEEIARIRNELGTEMSAFEAVDESVHVASERLHEAARARDLATVVQRLNEVQSGCVSCHNQFRERLRTNTAGQ